MYAQLPEELPLYKGTVKNDNVRHPQEESYVDSLVQKNSLSGQNRVYRYTFNNGRNELQINLTVCIVHNILLIGRRYAANVTVK